MYNCSIQWQEVNTSIPKGSKRIITRNEQTETRLTSRIEINFYKSMRSVCGMWWHCLRSIRLGQPCAYNSAIAIINGLSLKLPLFSASTVPWQTHLTVLVSSISWGLYCNLGFVYIASPHTCFSGNMISYTVTCLKISPLPRPHIPWL